MASDVGLNDSWVDLNLSGNGSNIKSGESTPKLEKLLIDAQKESGLTSRNSSGRNSSKALHSPPLSAVSVSSEELGRINIDPEQLTEFMKDWSSRPEIIPPRVVWYLTKNSGGINS